MDLEELKKKLRQHNQEMFSKLQCGEVEDESLASVRVPVDKIATKAAAGPRFCARLSGLTKNASDVGQLVGSCIDLENQNKVGVVVGSVIDNDKHAKTGDLPVVLAVGINYGQGNWYIKNSVMLQDDTEMRSRAVKVLEKICSDGDSSLIEPEGPFHLVATNFFPWITNWSWSEYNSIEESILLRCAGHADPVSYVGTLIDLIHPDVVIFHGANNAVPRLGWEVIDANFREDGHFIFSDNLAPLRQVVTNAVAIRRLISRASLRVVDYDS